jgi:hypothetical protein
MHGLVNRSIQCFLRDVYGQALWAGVAHDVGIGDDGFEAMLAYDDRLTDAVLSAAAARLVRPLNVLLEDLGSYLVSLEPLRRLLRFGGAEYADFLDSLDELPDRARLAVAEIGLPDIEVAVAPEGVYFITLRDGRHGFAAVFSGLLRAMADDYGALALIDAAAGKGAGGIAADPVCQTIRVELLDARHASGRAFHLAQPVPPTRSLAALTGAAR